MSERAQPRDGREFETLADLSPDGIVLVNREGVVLYANSALAALLETRVEDLLGESFGFPVAADEPSEIRLVVEGKPTRTAEVRVVQIVWQGQSAYLATLRDISDHLWLVEELKRSNRDLDSFAYAASHDLKSPLRNIRNLATWITQEAGDILPEASREDLGLLHQSIARMESLLDSLLQYCRIGQAAAEAQQIDTTDMVTDILALIETPTGFTIDVTAGMPIVHSPAAPLELVWRNLIGNAIKHHNRTDGCIAISGREMGARVEFTVSDDGPGIPSAYHDQIFQLFETLQSRDQVEGSGMGLAMVKKLVTSYGGTIRVESRDDGGACFRFTWPKDTTQRGDIRYS